jgi:hypothetical protein
MPPHQGAIEEPNCKTLRKQGGSGVDLSCNMLQSLKNRAQGKGLTGMIAKPSESRVKAMTLQGGGARRT